MTKHINVKLNNLKISTHLDQYVESKTPKNIQVNPLLKKGIINPSPKKSNYNVNYAPSYSFVNKSGEKYLGIDDKEKNDDKLSDKSGIISNNLNKNISIRSNSNSGKNNSTTNSKKKMIYFQLLFLQRLQSIHLIFLLTM